MQSGCGLESLSRRQLKIVGDLWWYRSDANELKGRRRLYRCYSWRIKILCKKDPAI
jgi:hypothetical protein